MFLYVCPRTQIHVYESIWLYVALSIYIAHVHGSLRVFIHDGSVSTAPTVDASVNVSRISRS